MELKQTSLLFSILILQAFNCTLWNWNTFTGKGNTNNLLLLIVPYGIETAYAVNC